MIICFGNEKNNGFGHVSNSTVEEKVPLEQYLFSQGLLSLFLKKINKEKKLGYEKKWQEGVGI